MTKTTTTPAMLDRLSGALAKHGITLKRTHLLQVAATALGYKNTHELTADDKKGELAFPAADYLAIEHTDHGNLVVMGEPEGGVFAVQVDKLLQAEGRKANTLVSPYGGILDVSNVLSQLKNNLETSPSGPQATSFNVEMGPAKVACGNCDWTGKEDDCGEIENFHERVGPGETVPVGECPECGALAHYSSHEDEPYNPDQVLCLTNGCCEHAYGSEELLDALGLPYGEFDGDFYPLTDEEASYIAEDVVNSLDGSMSAMTGYSALYRGKKYINPTIELPVAPHDDFPPEEEVLAFAKRYVEAIRPKVEGLGGYVIQNRGFDDCVEISILVPFEKVLEIGQRWYDTLQWLLTDPTITDIYDGSHHRHEGRDFAVSVEWIGEGNDGDYDPMDSNDKPLLRFDAQRNVGIVDNEWEDLDNGSYCTQVSLFSPKEVRTALPRYLAQRLDVEGGAHPKRLMEKLSWTTEKDIKAFIENEGKRG